MKLKSLLLNIGKLLLCGITFAIGLVIGGMVVTLLGLQQPPMPEGMDSQSAIRLLLLESPLLALVLALLARHLAGGFWARALMLTALAWISNSLNNQIEASAFAGMASGFLFTIITFLFPSLFISLAVAWLFPSVHPAEGWLSECAKITFHSLGWVSGKAGERMS
ncbi:MAG: hypothetical protein M1282_01520 [Chloroflexi bacterium]|nr:hypothetical protein [Chloroflexota bacterium]